MFDLDGVLINNEAKWEKIKKEIFTEIYGKDIYLKLGSTLGIGIGPIHKKAIRLGAKAPFKNLENAWHKYALKIYKETSITDGIEKLGKALVENDYGIAIVSASPKSWVNLVINRLSFRKNIAAVISLHDRPDLKHKPEPDGYLEAIKFLKSHPSKAFVLEDSNVGIQAGKNAGARVIGLRQNLIKGYVQKGADIYVNKVEEIIKII
jgi:HAD superfamily hydrolase (TIGR01509 family)